MRRVVLSVLLSALILGCGKTPESEAAKKLGEQPKNIVNKAEADVNKALQQGMQRQDQAEKQAGEKKD